MPRCVFKGDPERSSLDPRRSTGLKRFNARERLKSTENALPYFPVAEKDRRPSETFFRPRRVGRLKNRRFRSRSSSPRVYQIEGIGKLVANNRRVKPRREIARLGLLRYADLPFEQQLDFYKVEGAELSSIFVKCESSRFRRFRGREIRPRSVDKNTRKSLRFED